MARPVPLIATLGKCMKEMERHAQGGQSMLDQTGSGRHLACNVQARTGHSLPPTISSPNASMMSIQQVAVRQE